jgi:SpoVK/Ycf46/Vps4 family AAA+-type ATPase
MSPADLKALCQEAALSAMARSSGSGSEQAPGADAGSGVTHQDFVEALRRLRGSAAAPARGTGL